MPESAHQAGRQIGNDVAVEVRHHQQVEGLRAHHQLHAGVVHDQFVVLNIRKMRRHFAAALQKQAVAQLHDVGLVNGGHFLAALAARILEAARAIRMDAFCVMILRLSTTPGHHFVLQARVQVLGVLAKDRKVERQVVKSRLQTGQHPHRPEIRIQAQLLAQRDIDALVSAADRRGGRALQSDARDFERREDVVGNQLPVFGQRARAGLDAVPFDRDAGRVHGANCGFGYFRSDSVAGDEGNLVGHHSYYRVGGVLDSRLGSGATRNGGDATAQARHSRRAGAAPPCCEIPREEFVPPESRVLAYRDDPVQIGYGQTISQPYMTALMAEVLELTRR